MKKPHLSVAANNLAFYYAEYDPSEENLAKAERLILPLMQKHKDAPNMIDTAAWVYFRQGKYEKARDLLTAAEGTAKESPVISFHLGMIYHRLGKDDEAREYLQNALESEEAFAGRKEAEATLKGLK
jgi:predicted Zn-dependent protease